MPVIHPGDALQFETDGSRFLSYVRPSRGSTQLCAWQLTVPADLHGVAHRPTREEPCRAEQTLLHSRRRHARPGAAGGGRAVFAPHHRGRVNRWARNEDTRRRLREVVADLTGVGPRITAGQVA